jgi:hypothetical protein
MKRSRLGRNARFSVQLYDRRLKRPKLTEIFMTEKQMLAFVKKNSKPNRIVIEGHQFATPEEWKKMTVKE